MYTKEAREVVKQEQLKMKYWFKYIDKELKKLGVKIGGVK